MAQSKESQVQEIIDLPAVLERIGGDECFLQELIKIFIEEYNLKLPPLEKAVEEDNFQLIQEIAHSLKGSSANLSLLELQKIAHALETYGRQADKKGCLENLARLKTAFGRLIGQMKHFSWWKE